MYLDRIEHESTAVCASMEATLLMIDRQTFEEKLSA